MGTTAAKLQYMEDAIVDAYAAVNEKGVTLAETTPLAQLGPAIRAITSSEPPHEVRFFDIDGTIISAKRYATGANADFPPAPTRPHLTFNGWTHTQADLNNMNFRESERNLKIPGHIDVGATYKTDDDRTHIWFLARTAYAPNLALYFAKQGTIAAQINIDWGDGSAVEKFTIATTNTKPHTYAAEGEYHIQIWSDDNLIYGLGNGASTSPIATTGKQAITKAYISNFVVLKSYSFSGFTGLSEVSLPPKGVTSVLPTYILADCNLLPHVTVPPDYTSIGANSFQNDVRLISVVLSPTITSFGASAFLLTPMIGRLVFPKGIDEFADSLFNTGSAAEFISDTIRTLGANAFNAWYLSHVVNLAKAVTCNGTATFANAYSLAITDIDLYFTTAISSTALLWAQRIGGTIAIRGVAGAALPTVGNFNSCEKLIIGANFTSITGAIVSAGIMTYVFEGTTPPTLSGQYNISNLNKLASIYVPDEAVAAYKAATNWTPVAAFIKPMSELPP